MCVNFKILPSFLAAEIEYKLAIGDVIVIVLFQLSLHVTIV